MDTEEKIDLQTLPSLRKSSFLLVAAFLLIIAGVFSIIIWSNFLTIDESDVAKLPNLQDFMTVKPDITLTEIKDMLQMCAIVGIIISIFPILGGILTLRRKMYLLVIICGVLGMLQIIVTIIPGILSFIALILVFMSKREFQGNAPKIE